MSFLVYVTDSEGDPVENAEVQLFFTDPLRGHSEVVLTDSDGVAEFDNYKKGGINVYVDREDPVEAYYEDGESISITI